MVKVPFDHMMGKSGKEKAKRKWRGRLEIGNCFFFFGQRQNIANGFVEVKIMQYFVDTRLLIFPNYFADSPPHFTLFVLLLVNLIYYSYS